MAADCKKGFDGGNSACNSINHGSTSQTSWGITACYTGVLLKKVKDNNKCQDKGGILSSAECKSYAQSKGLDVNNKNQYNDAKLFFEG